MCNETLVPAEVICLACLAAAAHPTPAQCAQALALLQERAPNIAGLVAGFDYQASPTVRRQVQALKYERRPDIGQALGLYLGGLAARQGLAAAAIIPVPLHTRRQADRGYNQSERIAQGVARMTALPVQRRTLVRIKDTRRQAGLSRASRQANVAGAFALRRPVSGAVLLVDDVLTTGATLTAAAQALSCPVYVAVVGVALSEENL